MPFPDPSLMGYASPQTLAGLNTSQVPPGYDPQQWAAFAAQYPEQAANILAASQQVDTRTPEQTALTNDAFEYNRTHNLDASNFIKAAGLLFGVGSMLPAAGSYGAAAGSAAGGAGAYGGPATTYALPAGGQITGSAIPGVTSGTTAAGASAAGIAPAVAGGGSRIGNFLDNWGPEIAGGVNTILGYRAAGDAADAEAAAFQAAIDEQRRQYDTTRTDYLPAINAMRDAHTQMGDPLNYFQKSPDYDFIRGEGTRDIGNSWAAAGGSMSGNAMKALTEFNDNLAKGEFGNWFNRQATRAGLGTTGTNAVTTTGNNTSGNVSNFLAGQGVSRASGVLDRNAVLGNGVQDFTRNYLSRRRRAA